MRHLELKIFSSALLILCFFTLLFLFIGDQKGFEIADEGFILLSSQYPSEVLIWPNVAHVYTALMYTLVHKNVILVRILSQLLIFLSASFFFFTLLRLMNIIYPNVMHKLKFKIIGWSMICMGALFYYVPYFRTPCYNTINVIALYLAAGFFFVTLSSNQSSFSKLSLNLISSFASGFCIGIALLVKFPTAFALFFLFSFVIMIWPQFSWNNLLLNSLMIIVGSLAWIAIHIITLQSWSSLWHTLYYGIFSFYNGFGPQVPSHEPFHCLSSYALEIIRVFIQAIKNFWFIYLSLAIGMFIFNRILENKSTKNISYFLIITFTLAGCYSIALNFYKGGMTNCLSLVDTYTSWLLLITFALLFLIFDGDKLLYLKNNSNVRKLIILSFLLFMLPFAGAFGTANVITLNLSQYMAAWFALFLMILYLLSFLLSNQGILISVSFILCLFASLQIISAGYISPYNLNTTVEQQTILSPIGYPVTYLKLDKPTSDFFNKLRQIALSHEFKPGDDIIAFSNIAGIVFALGGKSPVVPLYFPYSDAKLMNKWFLQQSSIERIKKAFILQSKSGTESIPDFISFGKKFPSDYILCGEVVWPLTGEWVRLWKPKLI